MASGKRQRGISNPGLWAAIRHAPLPGAVQPDGLFGRLKEASFQNRLMAAHDLTEFSALRLEEEYRRYLYLKTIDGGPLTPSKRVDQAWHLHIETPGQAWSRYCDEVLGMRLVHHTGLTPDEARAGYARLRALYRQEFGCEPQEDIWPEPRQNRRKAIGTAVTVLGVAMVLGSQIVLPVLSDEKGLVWFGGIAGIALAVAGNRIAKGTDLETAASCA